MTTFICARAGRVALLAIFCRGWAAKQKCTVDEHGQRPFSSLLQSRALKAHRHVELRDDAGAPVAWAASSFGDCLPDCGSQKFRSVVCASVFDGQPAPDSACAGAKPASSAPCVCGGAEACAPPPADGACPPADAGSGADSGGHVEVGCFGLGEPDAHGKGPLHDLTCMKWSSAAPCMGGLPFYAVDRKDMDAGACYSFCLSKGMDIFGLEQGETCRCGASALNKEVWHEEAPRPGLLFDPSALQAPRSGRAAKACPLKVYRYSGHYEDDGVPSAYWDIREGDLEYVDSVVTGKEVGEFTEEDGTPKPEEGLLATEERRQTPGFDRPCWPGNCGPGRGPWRDRSSLPPAGTQDVWKEYVLINFTYESNVDSGRKAGFRAAVEEWKNKTCINLIEQTTVPSGPHIRVGIYDTGSCYLSGMGYGTSRINLGWCNSLRYLGSMIHEIGHAIGMNHEQKRPDATTNYHGHGPFLQMYWDQIPSRWLPQYLPSYSSYTGSASDGPADPHAGWAEYDFGSIMHYPGGSRYDVEKDSAEAVTTPSLPTRSASQATAGR